MSNGERFWDEVMPFLTDGRVQEGTMFGNRCIRAGKAFIAMAGHKSDGMVIKLPADRVTEIVDSGKGIPVAPAGKVFKEWVEVAAAEQWRPYLEEAIGFATD